MNKSETHSLAVLLNTRIKRRTTLFNVGILGLTCRNFLHGNAAACETLFDQLDSKRSTHELIVFKLIDYGILPISAQVHPSDFTIIKLWQAATISSVGSGPIYLSAGIEWSIGNGKPRFDAYVCACRPSKTISMVYGFDGYHFPFLSGGRMEKYRQITNELFRMGEVRETSDLVTHSWISIDVKENKIASLIVSENSQSVTGKLFLENINGFKKVFSEEISFIKSQDGE